MKKGILLVASVVAVSLAAIQAKATIIADWTFETSVPTTAGPYSPEVGAGSASGSHAGAAVYSNPAGNGSAHSYSSTLWAVGDYWQFQVSTTGLAGEVLDWDQTSSGTGPGKFLLEYSTDGTTFATNGAVYTVLLNGGAPNAAWNATTSSAAYHFTVDLSSITALDNQATDFFRLVDANTTSAAGGTVATGGTDRVDNFTVSVPEPSTVILVGTGMLGLLTIRRRRS